MPLKMFQNTCTIGLEYLRLFVTFEMDDELIELISQSDHSVPSIFIESVRNSCSSGEECSKMLMTVSDIQERSKTVISKMRFYFYQILVLFEICTKENIQDPIDGTNYKKILMFTRAFIPLCISFGGDDVYTFLSDINEYFGETYPLTIEKLQLDVGLLNKEPDLSVQTRREQRLHYADAKEPEKHEEPKQAPFDFASIRQAYAHGRPSALTKIVKVRIKKPHSHEKLHHNHH